MALGAGQRRASPKDMAGAAPALSTYCASPATPCAPPPNRQTPPGCQLLWGEETGVKKRGWGLEITLGSGRRDRSQIPSSSTPPCVQACSPNWNGYFANSTPDQSLYFASVFSTFNSSQSLYFRQALHFSKQKVPSSKLILSVN